MTAFDLELGRLFDALNHAQTPDRRGNRLLDICDLFGRASVRGGPDARTAHDLATLFDLLADVEFTIAEGGRRVRTTTPFEGVCGSVLDQMVAEPDVAHRAELLEALADVLEGVVSSDLQPVVSPTVREVLASVPYRPGFRGWSNEPYQPATLKGAA